LFSIESEEISGAEELENKMDGLLLVLLLILLLFLMARGLSLFSPTMVVTKDTNGSRSVAEKGVDEAKFLLCDGRISNGSSREYL
jgi:hypothetical protein